MKPTKRQLNELDKLSVKFAKERSNRRARNKKRSPKMTELLKRLHATDMSKDEIADTLDMLDGET